MSSSNPKLKGHNWLKALTDGPNFQRTTAITIALTLDVSKGPNPVKRTWDIEPPPHIDYWQVHDLIRLAERALTDADKKRYNRLSAARRAYYLAHCCFQHAYHGLADARAYEKMLDAERRDMGTCGERREGQWAESERQKERNAKDLLARLDEVKKMAEVRKAATLLLSREKRAFLDRDVHRLAFLCKHAHGQYNLNASTGTWQMQVSFAFDVCVRLAFVGSSR